jgi:alpha-N-arabinofuranosidase
VGDRYVRTPVYSVFAMYRPHMGGRALPLRIDLPPLTVPLLEGTGTLPAVSGSASLRERTVTVTLTNPSLGEAVTTRIRVAGGVQLREARASVLTHADMRAANTFDRPDEVVPGALDASVSGDAASVRLPPRAVAAVSLRLV